MLVATIVVDIFHCFSRYCIAVFWFKGQLRDTIAGHKLFPLHAKMVWFRKQEIFSPLLACACFLCTVDPKVKEFRISESLG